MMRKVAMDLGLEHLEGELTIIINKGLCKCEKMYKEAHYHICLS